MSSKIFWDAVRPANKIKLAAESIPNNQPSSTIDPNSNSIAITKAQDSKESNYKQANVVYDNFLISDSAKQTYYDSKTESNKKGAGYQLTKFLKWNKNAYVVNDPWKIRLTYLFGLVSFVMVIAGFLNFLNTSLWFWLVFGPMAIVIFSYRIIMYAVNAIYPKFHLDRHSKFVNDFWHREDEPSVDVFLPVCGESIEILKGVWESVKELNYENYHVVVLDDKGESIVKKLAEDFGFQYLSRPNKGEWKKSGNLQYGYDNTSGDYTLVLDADFETHPGFLKETIPYMATNPGIGILQTPQYFQTDKQVNRRSPLEYGSGNVVEDFYRITMPSRSQLGGGMCVGTSAIYRRQAIIDGGGSPKINGSEDVRQGLFVNAVGYEVRYIPLVLSRGICPDNLEAYFKQHNRWCTGSVELFFSQELERAKVSFLGRICYLMNFFYYVTEAIGPLFALHLYALLIWQYDSLDLTKILLFIPHLIFYYILLPNTKIAKPTAGTRLAAMSNIFTYVYTIPMVILKKKLAWVTTNVKISKIAESFITMSSIGIGYTAFCTFLLGVIVILRPTVFTNINALPIMFWILLSLACNYQYSYQTVRYIWSKKREEIGAGLSNYASLFGLLWQRVALVGVTAIFLFSSVVFTLNNQSPLIQAQEITIVQSFQVSSIQSKPKIVTDTVKVPTLCATGQSPIDLTVIANRISKVRPTYFEFRIEPGQSLSQLAALGLSDYQQNFNTERVDQVQATFVQNCLSLSRTNTTLRAGQNIRFTAEEISAQVIRSRGLTLLERKALEENVISNPF